LKRFLYDKITSRQYSSSRVGSKPITITNSNSSVTPRDGGPLSRFLGDVNSSDEEGVEVIPSVTSYSNFNSPSPVVPVPVPTPPKPSRYINPETEIQVNIESDANVISQDVHTKISEAEETSERSGV
jgi:hypothetical protein